jgi:hypothetical protein
VQGSSGATLVEDDHVIAMYHGTEVGNMVAVSSDPMLVEPGESDRQGRHPHEKPRWVAAPLPCVRSEGRADGRNEWFLVGAPI